jgi:hypothetical protein
MKLYEFAAVYLPDEDSNAAPKIIVSPTTILAKDEKQALMLAARAIPEQYVDKLEFVEIAVRPF